MPDSFLLYRFNPFAETSAMCAMVKRGPRAGKIIKLISDKIRELIWANITR